MVSSCVFINLVAAGITSHYLVGCAGVEKTNVIVKTDKLMIMSASQTLITAKLNLISGVNPRLNMSGK